MSRKKFELKLVERQGEKIFTTSLVVAEGCEQNHKIVIRLVRRYKSDFEELGKVNFQSSLNPQGSPTEFAILNEDQATYLITLFRNNDIVRRFKLTLVKEFRKAIKELSRIHSQQTSETWKEYRRQVKESFRMVGLVLQETRKLLGKETEKHHFSNEARLMNGVLTGEYKGLVRDELTDVQLKILDAIEQENSRLMIQGKTYQERKAALLEKFIPKLPEALH